MNEGRAITTEGLDWGGHEGLLRWAAEEVLGWTDPWPWGWLDAAGHTYGTSSLKGWPGFGLALEVARTRKLIVSWSDAGESENCVTVWNPEDARGWTEFDADPGIAAWRALREALNA